MAAAIQLWGVAPALVPCSAVRSNQRVASPVHSCRLQLWHNHSWHCRAAKCSGHARQWQGCRSRHQQAALRRSAAAPVQASAAEGRPREQDDSAAGTGAAAGSKQQQSAIPQQVLVMLSWIVLPPTGLMGTWMRPRPLTSWRRRWLLEHAPALASAELLQRSVVTLLMILIIRAGEHVRLPGAQEASVAVLASIRGMVGRSAQAGTLVSLGAGPILDASLLLAVYVQLRNAKLLRPPSYWPSAVRDLLDGPVVALEEGGTEGQGTFALWNNYITLLVALFQGFMYARQATPGALIPTTCVLLAGCCILNLCANTAHALGLVEGLGLLIVLSSASRYGSIFSGVRQLVQPGHVEGLQLACVVGGLLALISVASAVLRMVVELPVVQYKARRAKMPMAAQPQAKQPASAGKRISVGSRAGQPVLGLPLVTGLQPIVLANWTGIVLMRCLGAVPSLHGAALWFKQSSWGLTALQVAGVFLFSTVVLGGLTPTQLSEWLEAIEIGIKGVASPGEATLVYLKGLFLRIGLLRGLTLSALLLLGTALDCYLLAPIGAEGSTFAILLLMSTCSTTVRQIESLSEVPQFDRRMEQERQLLNWATP